MDSGLPLSRARRKDDLREIPSVIAGHQNIRTSIVLAKSIPAKRCGVKTGEPLGMARDKCPDLVVAEPDYDLYVSASQKLNRPPGAKFRPWSSSIPSTKRGST